jgi:hypothetical protein
MFTRSVHTFDSMEGQRFSQVKQGTVSMEERLNWKQNDFPLLMAEGFESPVYVTPGSAHSSMDECSIYGSALDDGGGESSAGDFDAGSPPTHSEIVTHHSFSCFGFSGAPLPPLPPLPHVPRPATAQHSAMLGNVCDVFSDGTRSSVAPYPCAYASPTVSEVLGNTAVVRRESTLMSRVSIGQVRFTAVAIRWLVASDTSDCCPTAV